MTKILIVLVIAYSFEAIGVITLKRGIDKIGPRFTARKASTPLLKNILKLLGEWFTNKNILLGLLFETTFFALLQYLLGQRDVSFVWPLTAVSFVMTPLAAMIFLHERVDATRWGGIALIILGAVVVNYSEHGKQKSTPRPTTAKAKVTRE